MRIMKKGTAILCVVREWIDESDCKPNGYGFLLSGRDTDYAIRDNTSSIDKGWYIGKYKEVIKSE